MNPEREEAEKFLDRMNELTRYLNSAGETLESMLGHIVHKVDAIEGLATKAEAGDYCFDESEKLLVRCCLSFTSINIRSKQTEQLIRKIKNELAPIAEAN